GDRPTGEDGHASGARAGGRLAGQPRLADPTGTDEGDRAALTVAERRDRGVDRLQLRTAADQGPVSGVARDGHAPKDPACSRPVERLSDTSRRRRAWDSNPR